MSRQPKPSGLKLVVGGGRSENSYRRQPGGKQRSPIILIICEGKETEPRYFEALRGELRIRKAQVRVIPGGDGRGAPTSIVKMALRKQHEMEMDLESGDQTWCVFDTEQQGKYPDLAKVIEHANRKGLLLAVSNPSFEYWYVLHFECTDRPFANAAEVIERLRSHLPQYTENNKSMNVFACIKDRTETALANTNTLRQRADQDWNLYPNPSTSVDRLVRYLRSLSDGEKDAPRD